MNPEDPEPDLFISRTYATIGDYAKAIQYAEQAVKDRATDPNLRGNYGVMLFRNFLYQPALEQLERAVKGGKSEDGLPITGMPLATGGRVVEYYYTYGLALARTNQCGEALKISQQIKTAVATDENAVFAADEIDSHLRGESCESARGHTRCHRDGGDCLNRKPKLPHPKQRTLRHHEY